MIIFVIDAFIPFKHKFTPRINDVKSIILKSIDLEPNAVSSFYIQLAEEDFVVTQFRKFTFPGHIINFALSIILNQSLNAGIVVFFH